MAARYARGAPNFRKGKNTMIEKETFSLSERAILVDLRIGRWYARRKDDKVTAEVTKRHKTDKKAGNWRKHLLPFEAPTYEAILSHIDETRDFHRKNTLPWSDTGLRILPNANYEHYTTGMREREHKFRELVDTFAPDLFRKGGLKDQARVKLNGMFRDDDYPRDEAELRSKFTFEIEPYPLPDTGDLRVKLTDTQVDAIKARVESTIRNASVGALTEGWNRLLFAVRHAGEIFANPSARVTRALFENLSDTCELLMRLNPTENANFESIAREVKDSIASLDRKVIRKDKDARKAAAEQTAAIEKRMAGFMRGVTA